MCYKVAIVSSTLSDKEPHFLEISPKKIRGIKFEALARSGKKTDVQSQNTTQNSSRLLKVALVPF